MSRILFEFSFVSFRFVSFRFVSFVFCKIINCILISKKNVAHSFLVFFCFVSFRFVCFCKIINCILISKKNVAHSARKWRPGSCYRAFLGAPKWSLEGARVVSIAMPIA